VHKIFKYSLNILAPLWIRVKVQLLFITFMHWHALKSSFAAERMGIYPQMGIPRVSLALSWRSPGEIHKSPPAAAAMAKK
jgi:hypothetical protein